MKVSLSTWGGFERAYLFLPVLCTVLYVPQSLWGKYVFGDWAADTTSKVIVLGLCAYVLSYILISRMSTHCTLLHFKDGLSKINSEHFLWGIYVLYLVFIVYVLVTSKKIAVLEALKGRSVDDIAFAREELFKARLGWERSLAYLNAIFTSALIPFIVSVAYVKRRAYRHAMLLVFCLTLMPSLEKALILKGVLPVVMLGLNGYFPVARALKLAAVAAIVVAMTFVVSKMGDADYLTSNVKTLQTIESELVQVQNNIQDYDVTGKSDSPQMQVERRAIFLGQLVQLSRQRQYYLEAVNHGKKYNAFGSGQSKFIANRIFWIPYVTAYDWISYFDQKLERSYLHGATSSLVAVIAGVERFPMESEVFRFQFGDGGPQTAAANANFWIDAFVNFGWLGVLVYSFLFAAITFLLVCSNYPAALACYYLFVIQVSVSGMIGVLLSNGLLILVALAYLVPVSKDDIAPELSQGR